MSGPFVLHNAAGQKMKPTVEIRAAAWMIDPARTGTPSPCLQAARLILDAFSRMDSIVVSASIAPVSFGIWHTHMFGSG